MAWMLIVSALLMACTPVTIPLGADTPYYGRIERGSKFGVTIHDGQRSARGTLERASIRYEATADCGDSGILTKLLACERGEMFEIYGVSDSTRHGSIYLKISDEHVEAIAWDLRLLPDATF